MHDSEADRRQFDSALAWIRKQGTAKHFSLAAVVLAFVDTFIHPISLTALGLLVLASLPWLIPLVRSFDLPLKSMKLPGGVEFEFNQLEQMREQAASAGLLRPPEHEYSFQTIFDQDPNLAVAGLRIELERRLRELGKIAGINVSRTAIPHLVRALGENGTLDRSEISVIADLLPTLNQAVHAHDLDTRAFDWAMDVGPQLLAGLDAKIRGIKVATGRRRAPGGPR
jgi:hypothetical protein